MLRCPRSLHLLLGALLVASGCKSSAHPSPARPQIAATSASASISDDAPATLRTTVVRARVRGDLTVEGAFSFAIEQEVVEGGVRETIASLPLARFIGAEYARDDLCSDDGSDADQIAVRCIGELGTLVRLVAAREGAGLAVRSGAASPTTWKSSFPARLELQGFSRRGDLEPLRAAFANDAPSARCGSAKSTHPLPVTVRLDALRDKSCGLGSTSYLRSRATLEIGRKRTDLGVLDDQCAGIFADAIEGPHRIELRTSDDDSAARVLYQLGDRVYFSTDGEHVAAVDLPCGARARFGVDAPGQTLFVDGAKSAIHEVKDRWSPSLP